MKQISINNLNGPIIITLVDPGEPPPTLSVSYPGDVQEAPEGTVSYKKTAIYLNANLLPEDLRRQCVQYLMSLDDPSRTQNMA